MAQAGGGGGGHGIRGATGPRGETGPGGGAQGITGVQGITGISPADRGETGPQGQTGPQGFAGFGVQGVTGVKGQTGPFGQTGVPGQTGVQGQTGVRGQTGPQGQTGLQGQTGIRGLTGLQGQTGIRGATGAFGETGLQGVTGPDGQVDPLAQWIIVQGRSINNQPDFIEISGSDIVLKASATDPFVANIGGTVITFTADQTITPRYSGINFVYLRNDGTFATKDRPPANYYTDPNDPAPVLEAQSFWFDLSENQIKQGPSPWVVGIKNDLDLDPLPALYIGGAYFDLGLGDESIVWSEPFDESPYDKFLRSNGTSGGRSDNAGFNDDGTCKQYFYYIIFFGQVFVNNLVLDWRLQGPLICIGNNNQINIRGKALGLGGGNPGIGGGGGYGGAGGGGGLPSGAYGGDTRPSFGINATVTGGAPGGTPPAQDASVDSLNDGPLMWMVGNGGGGNIIGLPAGRGGAGVYLECSTLVLTGNTTEVRISVAGDDGNPGAGGGGGGILITKCKCLFEGTVNSPNTGTVSIAPGIGGIAIGGEGPGSEGGSGKWIKIIG